MISNRTTPCLPMLVTAGLLVVLCAQTGCESSDTPSVTPADDEGVEGACSAADDCLLLAPPAECDGQWLCEEGTCQHQCLFASCETPSDCTIVQRCDEGICVDDVDDEPEVTCVVTGCSSEICAPEPTDSTCIDLVEYECLMLTTCGAFGPDGACGWEQTGDYLDCLAALQEPLDPCADVTCSNGETCVDGVCVAQDPCAEVTCSDGETCVDGACVPGDPCAEVLCSDGDTCVDGVCVEVGVEEPGCEADTDCAEGEICELGACEGKDDVPDPPVENCYVSGCSGEICSPEFMVNSDCSWLPEYECLLFTVCGPYGPDGACGWQPNDQYLECLEDVPGPPKDECTSDADCPPGEGCMAGVCASKPPLPPGLCLSSADCKPGAQCIDGMCVGGGIGGACIATGCSGEICAPVETMSDCAWLPEYDCFQYTECGPFGLNGLCHWQKTPEYLECLLGIDGPGPGPGDGMCTSDWDCTKPASKCNASEICLAPPDGGAADVCWGECVPKEAGDPCDVDSDCPDDMLCQCMGPGGGGPPLPNALLPPCSFQCVPKDDPPAEEEELCMSDEDCKEPGTKCNSGEICLSPPDGGAAAVCWGECVPTEEGDSCDTDFDCPADMTCECGGFGGPNFFAPCFLECTPADDPPPDEEMWCFQDADCPPGEICDPSGSSPWAKAPEGAPPPPPPIGACTNPCITTGCSGILCASEPMNSTCNWQPSYACYAQDVCGAFGDGGACQWQGNDAFEACMAGFENQ